MTALDSNKIYFAPNATIYVAPSSGATLPTDLTTPIGTAFRQLGYTGEDGVSVTPTREWDPVPAHQSASPVKYVLQSASLTLKFVCLQTDEDTVSLYFGNTWTEVGGVKKLDLKSSPNLVEYALVLEYGDYTETDDGSGGVTITGNKNRLVIPRGMVSEVEDFTIARTETMSLGVTFAAMDLNGSLGYLLTNAEGSTSP